MFSPVPRVSISCSIWYLRVVLPRSREEQCQRVYEQRYIRATVYAYIRARAREREKRERHDSQPAQKSRARLFLLLDPVLEAVVSVARALMYFDTKTLKNILNTLKPYLLRCLSVARAYGVQQNEEGE